MNVEVTILYSKILQYHNIDIRNLDNDVYHHNDRLFGQIQNLTLFKQHTLMKDHKLLNR